MKKVSLYIHIPFCKSRCYYCDFISSCGKENLIDEYIKWLKYEIKSVGEGIKYDYENNNNKDMVKVDTIYIGGGTPSYINSSYIKEIINAVKDNFIVEKNVEITIEVNPGTITKEKIREYKKIDINRISIGMQTTNDNILKNIGRIHSYSKFIETYEICREEGFKNINIDFMIGLPMQTLEGVKEDISKILKLDPEHISVYSLIVEENTKLEELIKKGTLILPNEDEERKMYWYVKEKLEENNYNHYEISNFSKKGYESKHNLNCWNQSEYIGFGVAAHSYTDNVRYSNIENIEEYIENYKNQEESNNFVFHEKQNYISKMKEYVILSLRKIEGIDVIEFKEKFEQDIEDFFHNEIEKLCVQQLIIRENNKIKLSNKGIDLANIVWEEFI